ncbi:MAG: hypothetical protein AAGK97_18755, partial [Bacteroidota bacterium]
QTQGETMAKIAAESEAEWIKEKRVYEALKDNPLIQPDTIAVLKARVEGLEDQYKSLTSNYSKGSFNLRKLTEGKPIVESLQNLYSTNVTQLTWEKDRYRLFKVSSTTPVSSIHLIDKAEVPVIKSRPRRSILVAGATIATFLFGALLALLIQTYRNTNWKALFRDESEAI